MPRLEINHEITKKYTKQKIDDIFHEFYRLYFQVDSGNIDIQNQLIIKLVTVIEQFFRKIVEIQYQNEKVQLQDKEITLRIFHLDQMKTITKGIIISSSYNFQSIKAIREGMKDVKITFSDKEIKHRLQPLGKLFKLRHDTVHTVMPVNTDNIGKYYDVVEKLMCCILEKVYRTDNYFYFYYDRTMDRLRGYEGSSTYYKKIIKLDAKNPFDYIIKGIVFDKLHDIEKAIACCDKAIEIEPTSLFGYLVQSNVYSNSGNHTNVIACYDKAIEIEPTSLFGYIYKSNSFRMARKYEEAIACYDEVIALEPKNLIGYIHKAELIFISGKYEEAIACYDEAIKLDPNYSFGHIIKGISLDELDKHKEAVGFIVIFHHFIDFFVFLLLHKSMTHTACLTQSGFAVWPIYLPITTTGSTIPLYNAIEFHLYVMLHFLRTITL